MADLLETGVEFESFEAFQAAMENYEDTNFVQFTRCDSRSVEKAQEFTPTKVYNPAIQFAQLTYACTFGPRKVASRSNGIRNASSRKIDCPVRLRISATPDGQRLVVRESKLDGHNHDVSEELYQSMARQKQLDEETEMEIYNLVSTHNDKRLARMLVRERLTKHMGRSISVKDIINIEKKISRRLERDKMVESETAAAPSGQEETASDLKPEMPEGVDAGEQTTENCSPTRANVMSAQGEEQRGTQEAQSNDQEQTDERGEETKLGDQSTAACGNCHTSDIATMGMCTEKEESSEQQSCKPKCDTPSSSSRPQRQRREPRRFRDALTNGTKVLLTSPSKVVSILSPDEARQIGTEVVRVAPGSRSILKVKDEAGVGRGRKRKAVEDRGVHQKGETEEEEEEEEEEHISGEEYRRKKLAIQQELLEMEKSKMKILNDIVKKLDLIIEKQGTG